jgi:mono/diheme cytochrome c family protein
MKLKFLTVVALVALVFTSCGGDAKKEGTTNEAPAKQEAKKEVPKKETLAAKIDLNAPTLDNKGIGPIKSVKIADKIDEAMVAKGKELYKANCTACHKFKKRYIGPALKGVTQRRSPEWIMNMIMNSMEMLEKDPVAKALIAEYNAPMAQQSLKEEEARAIVEYFRTKN